VRSTGRFETARFDRSCLASTPLRSCVAQSEYGFLRRCAGIRTQSWSDGLPLGPHSGRRFAWPASPAVLGTDAARSEGMSSRGGGFQQSLSSAGQDCASPPPRGQRWICARRLVAMRSIRLADPSDDPRTPATSHGAHCRTSWQSHPAQLATGIAGRTLVESGAPLPSLAGRRRHHRMASKPASCSARLDGLCRCGVSPPQAGH
jgi:hypothetical protein